MSYEVESLEYKGHTIRLVQDEDAESPREWENVGEILYTSRRYTLGDKRVEPEELRAITEDENNIWLPVYAYIHGGTSLSTGSFRGRAPHADWDSGQCGIIWCTKSSAVKEWGKKICTKSVIEKAERYLKGEVEVYNQWINGEVVGYEIEGPLREDSCWGFFPDENGKYDYAINEAKKRVDHARKTTVLEKLEARHVRFQQTEQHLALI